MEKKDYRNLTIVITIVLAGVTPFIQKPFHIDDPYFIEIARNILKSPLDPFHGAVTLLDQDYKIFQATGAMPNTFATMSHPPLFPYYLALIAHLSGGFREITLHLACLVFPILCAISAYLLARRFTEFPLAATLFFVTSPLLTVNAQNVMTDVPMLAIFLAALSLFISGTDQDSKGRLIGAGLLAGIAILVRYVAVCLIPLFLLYAFLRLRSLRTALVALLPAFVLFGLWVLQNEYYHGESHLLASSRHYLRFYEQISFSTHGIFRKLIGNVSAVGGAGIFALPVVLLLTERRELRALATCFLIATAIALWESFGSKEIADYTWSTSVIFTVFLSAGMFLAVRSPRFSLMFKNSESTDDCFLVSWGLGLFISSVLLLPFGTGRYVLPALLPVILMWSRKIQIPAFLARRGTKSVLVLAISMTTGLGWLLSVADYQFATAEKRTAQQITSTFQDTHIWFIGDWGFRYYMEEAGARYLISSDVSPNPGDLLVLADIARLHDMAPELRTRSQMIQTQHAPGGIPIRLMNRAAHAGFYAEGYGLLPYTISNIPLESFEIYRVQR